jgi:hypothetical protein
MRRLPSHSLLLLAVASVLAVLVGLVGSGERPAPRRPPPPPAEPPAERAQVRLATPVTRAVAEADAGAVPSERARPARSTRDPRGRLTGIVVLPGGEPAAGARVVLGQQQARCAADGRFELELAPVRRGADLLAFAPGHEPVLKPAFGATLGRDGDYTVRLVLGAETLTLSGTVVGAGKRPLEGWTVELEGRDVLTDFGLRDAVHTGADGTFVLNDVPAGVHVVRAWKERREVAFSSAPTSAGETGIEILVPE